MDVAASPRSPGARSCATILPSMTATLQREPWNDQPTYLGDLFRVSKARGDKTLTAVRRSG